MSEILKRHSGTDFSLWKLRHPDWQPQQEFTSIYFYASPSARHCHRALFSEEINSRNGANNDRWTYDNINMYDAERPGEEDGGISVRATKLTNMAACKVHQPTWQ